MKERRPATKALLIGFVSAAVLAFAVLIAQPARVRNEQRTQALLESIHQQLVLIEQHTRPAYQLTK